MEKDSMTLERYKNYQRVIGDGDSDYIRFIHTILASCSLPIRKPPDHTKEYHRKNGYMSLVVEAGYLPDEDGNMIRMSIPYSSKPRLLLIHLCSEAVKKQTNEIEIKDSMSAFIRSLGYSVTGGKNGTINSFKTQLNNLYACRFTLGWQQKTREGKNVDMLDVKPIKSVRVFFPRDPRQKQLWNSIIYLDKEFLSHLLRHSLPLDGRSLMALKHSSHALDTYLWLAYRLPRVTETNGLFLSYETLKSQFADDKTLHQNFVRDFKQAIRLVLSVYRGARVNDEGVGIRIYKSSPPISNKTVLNLPVCK